MQISIIIFGLLITAMAAVLLLSPARLTRFLLRHSGDPWLHILAAAIRIVLGIVLLLYAAESRFPAALVVLGWVALLAGVSIALVPPHFFRKMVVWAFDRFGRYTRVAALAVLVFGLFLVYAIV
jgi:hypothetical protein